MLASLFDKITDRIRWGYLTAFILLLLSYLLTFYSSQQVINQQQRVQHTTDVINTLDDLISEMRDAESSFRGYLIIKDKNFLTSYYTAPETVDSILITLKSLTKDNPIQHKRLDTLKQLIHKKLDVLSDGFTLFNANGYNITDSMKVMGYLGKQLMDDIKSMVVRLQNEENDLMITRTQRLTTLSNLIKVINVVSLVIAIVLALYSMASFNKENKARKAADKNAAKFREQLELRISELNKLNTELVELRSIEKFAATGRIARTIAHEVRNPLTNINLATEHLRSEVKPAAETDILFEMINRNSNRINDLISDLLNSTKTAQLHFDKVNINDILDASLAFAQDRIDLKKIKVTKKYDENLPQVLADAEKINIAFLNIIVNAIEAINKNSGEIIISTENKNNKCVVTISDNGKGMDKDALSKLFEPYFTTKEKGNGLGLTNTQNIILSHHANIHAESEEEKGTAFTIYFNYA